jgi:hypothetical protein
MVMVMVVVVDASIGQSTHNRDLGEYQYRRQEIETAKYIGIFSF